MDLADRGEREVTGLILQDAELDRVRRVGRAYDEQTCSNEGHGPRPPRNTF